MEKTFDETLQRLKGELPIPSDISTHLIRVPYRVYGFDFETGCPQYGSITFEKEYMDNICIGWKLHDVE